ncbi:sporulation integral membrane protein YtvI [Bacillus coahuilensis]|uniref:sporulation integral membrane protein YtvI n=1 Tax=Bacillus coahuilensis TaxID=408580 RepID=UPI00018514F2|nr:sporulation integral membrane protein YtvI [Bacillus coahuilensis]
MPKFFNRKVLTIIVTVVIITLLSLYILPISIPLISAFITALFLDPAVRVLRKRFNIKRKLSVLIVFVLFLLFSGLSLYFITTKVIGEAIQFAEEIPTYINQISDKWEIYEKDLLSASEDLPNEVVEQIQDEVGNFFNSVKSGLTNDYVNLNKISSFIGGIPNYLVNILVYLIALFLFMIDLPKIRTTIYKHLTEKTADKVNFMTSRLSYVVLGFLKAQFLVSVIIFIATLLGLLWIAPEAALVMSVVIWIVDFIPLIGSIVIMAPWFTYHFITGNIGLGTELAILATVLLIIRRTVEPKVMGRHIGLSPLATLIAMYLGLKLFGLLGFFIGPFILILFNSAKEAGIIKWNFKL